MMLKHLLLRLYTVCREKSKEMKKKSLTIDLTYVFFPFQDVGAKTVNGKESKKKLIYLFFGFFLTIS